MNIIDNIKINKIKNHLIFNKSVRNYKDINLNIFNLTLILMKEALKLKNKEVLLLFRNTDYAFEITTSYLENKVFLTTSMEEALLEENSITYTAIHNHTNDSNLSFDDINMLLKYDKLVMIIMCTNNCKHESIIYKTMKIGKDNADIIRNTKIDFNNKRYITMLENNGIYYIHRINY